MKNYKKNNNWNNKKNNKIHNNVLMCDVIINFDDFIKFIT